MLFLKNLFAKATAKTRTTATAKSAAFNPQPSTTPNASLSTGIAPATMTLASQIPDHYMPLWNLHKQRQLLEIKLGDASRTYQSMIIALDIERGLLWLDDLFPQQRLVDVGDEITLRHHRHGEHLVVRANVVALGASFGLSGLAILLPESAHYTPRRASERFTISPASSLTAKIRTLGQEPCYGTLQDISSGGMRINVAGNLLAQLRHGALLPLCEVSLDDGFQLRCRAKVCSFRMNRNPYRSTQISLEFVGINDATQERLNRFLRQMRNQQVTAECAA